MFLALNTHSSPETDGRTGPVTISDFFFKKRGHNNDEKVVSRWVDGGPLQSSLLSLITS